MELKKTYDIKRNGVSMLLRVGEEPLETDEVLNVYTILIASEGKVLCNKDGEIVGSSVCLIEYDKEDNYSEIDPPPEEEVEDES